MIAHEPEKMDESSITTSPNDAGASASNSNNTPPRNPNTVDHHRRAPDLLQFRRNAGYDLKKKLSKIPQFKWRLKCTNKHLEELFWPHVADGIKNAAEKAHIEEISKEGPLKDSLDWVREHNGRHQFYLDPQSREGRNKQITKWFKELQPQAALLKCEADLHTIINVSPRFPNVSKPNTRSNYEKEHCAISGIFALLLGTTPQCLPSFLDAPTTTPHRCPLPL